MYGQEKGRRGRATSWRRAAATRQLLSSHGLCFASNGRCCVCAPLPGPEVPLAFGTLKATLPLQQGISTSSNSARAQWGRRLPQLSSCCPPTPPKRGRAGRHMAGCGPQPRRRPCPPRSHDPVRTELPPPRPAPSSLMSSAPPLRPRTSCRAPRVLPRPPARLRPLPFAPSSVHRPPRPLCPLATSRGENSSLAHVPLVTCRPPRVGDGPVC